MVENSSCIRVLARRLFLANNAFAWVVWEKKVNQVGKLGSGQIVVDRYRSHLHESVLDILSEALSRVNLTTEIFAVEQVDFDRVVGETICVATSDADEIVFAQRPRRGGLTRFVKNRQPESCSSVVLILKKTEDIDETFVLITAFIGEVAEPEPWDENATEKSVEFWNTHALVWGSEQVFWATETKICPW